MTAPLKGRAPPGVAARLARPQRERAQPTAPLKGRAPPGVATRLALLQAKAPRSVIGNCAPPLRARAPLAAPASGRTRAALVACVLALGACRPRPATPLPAEPVRVGADSLDFGRTWVGFPERRTLELINPNRSALAVHLATAEPFAVVDAPEELPGGGSAVATLEFRPADAGVAAGEVTVNERSVALSGEGVLPPDCAVPSACATVAFSPDAGECLSSPRPDGTDCTSSFACFTAAACERGECVGRLTTCDDQNACTVDVCGAAGCAHLDGLPRCPVPTAPCRVATCEPDAGCGAGLAPDGTPCGASTCTLALVCIGGACVQRVPPAGQPCVDAACAAAGVGCGALSVDGGVVRCGTCSAGQVCDAVTRQCAPPPDACAAAGVPCGATVDACGLPVTCPNTCLGRCLGNRCGPNCTPYTCALAGTTCGVIGDGCGSVQCCGGCPAPYVCGGGGVRNVCDLPFSPPDGGPCPPLTCPALGANCGVVSDRCGGVLSCGSCTAPQTCGGGGVPNVCGSPHEAQCGVISVPFNLIDCGACPAGTTCGGGGAPYRCGVGLCTPLTCAQQGFACGQAGDGCGNLINCGSCTLTGACTTPLYTACARSVPLACRQLGLDCGAIQSACGPSVDCGACRSPLSCRSNRCAP